MRYRGCRALTILAAAAAWAAPAAVPLAGAAAAAWAADDGGAEAGPDFASRPLELTLGRQPANQAAPADGAEAGGDAAHPASVPDPSSTSTAVRPLHLSMLQDVESIYPQFSPQREDEGINLGGVNLHLNVNYLTDYVYRGIDRSDTGGAEDAPNLQFDGVLSFNLGKFPHPFVGLFVNVYNDDPLSRFQEVRPIVGFDWEFRPVTISAGQISYIFPEREDQNTNEVFLKLTLDDAFAFNSDKPVLTPYIFAAYDYDRYDGMYMEAGVKHDFPIEDTGVVLTAVADVGYSLSNRQFTRPPNVRGLEDTGFQHYDIGLIGSYSLNSLFNLSRRYGEFRLKGYLYYTDGLDNQLRSDTQLWGGVGVQFDY